MVFRKELLEHLRGRMVPLSELARAEGIRPKDLEQELQHLEKSLRREGLRLLIDPAECRKCGFVFGRRKLHKPGRCPQCRSTWIDEPRVGVEPRGG